MTNLHPAAAGLDYAAEIALQSAALADAAEAQPGRPGRALPGLDGRRPGQPPDRGAVVLGHHRRAAAQHAARGRDDRPATRPRTSCSTGSGPARCTWSRCCGPPIRPPAAGPGHRPAERRLRAAPPGAGGRRAPLGRRACRRPGRPPVDRRLGRLDRGVPDLLGLHGRPLPEQDGGPLAGAFVLAATDADAAWTIFDDEPAGHRPVRPGRPAGPAGALRAPPRTCCSGCTAGSSCRCRRGATGDAQLDRPVPTRSTSPTERRHGLDN